MNNEMCCFFCTQGPSQWCSSSTGYLEKAATGWKTWLTTAWASSSQTLAMMCGWQTAGGRAGPGDTSAFQPTRWNSGISGGLERLTKARGCFCAFHRALGRGGCPRAPKPWHRLPQGGWRELSGIRDTSPASGHPRGHHRGVHECHCHLPCSWTLSPLLEVLLLPLQS